MSEEANTLPSGGLDIRTAATMLESMPIGGEPAPHVAEGQVEGEAVETEEVETEELEGEELEGSEEESEEEFEEESEEGESEEESEEEEEEPTLTFVTKDGDGNEIEVTVNAEEAKSGYLRHEAYTRQRQADRAEVEQYKTEYVSKAEQAVTDLQFAGELITAGYQSRFGNINWEALRQQDPAKYQELRVQDMEARERLGELYKLQQGYQKDIEAAKEAELTKKLEDGEAYLKDYYPNWDEVRTALGAYVKEKGISSENILDPALVIAIDKARKFDELQTKKTSVKKTQVTATRSSRKNAKQAPKTSQQALFEQMGKGQGLSLKDAAQLLQSI